MNKAPKKITIISLLAFVIILIVSFAYLDSLPFSRKDAEKKEKGNIENSSEKDEVEKTDAKKVVDKSVKISKDFENAKISQKDLIQGCFEGKDCIPSIDDPQFETIEEADNWLEENDLIFVISFNGTKKIYPQKILNWHEIVNDQIGDQYFTLTFCPLCGSATAYERKVDGVITEFGNSGKLLDNNLIMYDRYEGSLWQQFTGEAIVGSAAQRDETLTRLPLTVTTWGKYKSEISEKESKFSTQVLSQNTGYTRNYDQYPYGSYEQDDNLLFSVRNLDSSLPLKTVVYGFEIRGTAKAYPESALLENNNIVDQVGGTTFQIKTSESGEISAQDIANGDYLVPLRTFWFAWAAFHPDTELYTNQ